MIVSYHIPKEKVSSLIPSEFQENIIRVFSRDPTKVRAVHEAFRRLMSRFSTFVDVPLLQFAEYITREGQCLCHVVDAAAGPAVLTDSAQLWR
jgi:hypothetical protein